MNTEQFLFLEHLQIPRVALFQAVLRYLTSYDLWQKAGALFPEQRTCKNDTNKLNGIIICKSVPIWQSNSSQLLQSYQTTSI